MHAVPDRGQGTSIPVRCMAYLIGSSSISWRTKRTGGAP
jgi:hypothetical protein